MINSRPKVTSLQTKQRMISKTVMYLFKNVFLLLVLSISQATSAQVSNEPRVHSHNDYEQDVPFWKAFSCGAQSIEADVILKGNTLYVAHSPNHIKQGRNIESLYLKPIQQALELYGIKNPIQLLIDLKTDGTATLDTLVNLLKKYPEITKSDMVKIVISGNRPETEDYTGYPKFISFDFQSLDKPDSRAVWQRVSLLSLDFGRYSTWNGKGKMPDTDYKKIKKIVDTAHGYGKPFRFWNTPDTEVAWKLLIGMGVDYINTDHPIEAVLYLEGQH